MKSTVIEFYIIKEMISEMMTSYDLKNYVDEFKEIIQKSSTLNKLDSRLKKEEDRLNAIVDSAQKLTFVNRSQDKNNCRPLKSIFGSLFDKDKKFFFRPNNLTLEDIFPEKDVNINVKDIKKLFKQFLNELNSIEDEQQLVYLLEKYFWCITYSDEANDVSLYQYIKTVIAISICLDNQYSNGEITIDELESITSIDTDQFLLLSGDLSGIQDFIFNIPSQGAAKSLKGRSVYLGLLSDVIVKYIIDELKLSESNLLYNGGGNFYLLIPKSLEEKVNKIRRYISEILLGIHRGELYMAIGVANISPTNFKDFSKVWRDASEKNGQLKQKKWSELDLENNFDKIFGPLDQGTKENQYCNICGISQKNRDLEEGICSFCSSFIELTNDIKKAKFIRIKKVNNANKEIYEYTDVFLKFGFEVEFLAEYERELDGEIYLLNSTDFITKKCTGYKFGAYKLPDDSKFDTLAQNSLNKVETKDGKIEEGDKKIGYLKLDVDNLGLIFIGGFKKNKSIARVTTLSRMMGLYFKGYINQLLNENLYVVFSGGDDTFVVGSWNSLMDFVKKFYDDFRKYTCQHEQITFSAGINIFHHKFPISRAAHLTEEALDDAKNQLRHEEKMPSKNKISFMGEVFNWHEFNKLKEIKEDLVEIVKSENNSRAILQKVMRSTIGFRKILKESTNKNLYNLKFWRLAYYLRELKREDSERIIDHYKEIVIDNLTGKSKEEKIENIMIIPVAVRWAELETKKNQGGEN